MINNGASAVREWMRNTVRLPQYTEVLINGGFDRFDFVRGLSADDLGRMGISTVEHQEQIMRAVVALGTSSVAAAHALEGLSAPPMAAAPPADAIRTRWGYGYFAIAMALYHLIWTALWMAICFIPHESHYAALFLFGGLLPSATVFVLVVMDSTVICCNPSGSARTKICCCPCFGAAPKVMVTPIAVAALLRVILYFAVFGILADLLNEWESEEHIDSVFFIVLSFAAFDVGPVVLLGIDWWYYYGKRDMNGLFGTHQQPLRVVAGQSVVVMILSWSFVAVFEEYADDALEFIWPWVCHGVVSTAVLLFCGVVEGSGMVNGNTMSSSCCRCLSKVFAALMAVLVLVILVFVAEHLVLWPIYVAAYYYTALTVPSIVGMASFKKPVAAQKNVAVEMQQKVGPLAAPQYENVPPASPGLMA